MALTILRRRFDFHLPRIHVPYKTEDLMVWARDISLILSNAFNELQEYVMSKDGRALNYSIEVEEGFQLQVDGLIVYIQNNAPEAVRVTSGVPCFHSGVAGQRLIIVNAGTNEIALSQGVNFSVAFSDGTAISLYPNTSIELIWNPAQSIWMVAGQWNFVATTLNRKI
jgi:hypothetical protein